MWRPTAVAIKSVRDTLIAAADICPPLSRALTLRELPSFSLSFLAAYQLGSQSVGGHTVSPCPFHCVLLPGHLSLSSALCDLDAAPTSDQNAGLAKEASDNYFLHRRVAYKNSRTRLNSFGSSALLREEDT